MEKIFKNKLFPVICALFLIFVAVFLLFHELFFGKIIATNDVGTNDLLFYNFPNRALYAQALKNGEFLQWTPMIYGGFPIFAEGQCGFLYPVNLIFCYLLSPVGAMNVYIIFHALFIGFGTYLFISRITSNKILSIPSGVAASICGSIIAGHTRHLNSLSTISFLPWLLWSVELFLVTKKPSRGLILGMLLGFMFLSGHPQYSFISGFYAILYLLLRLLFERSSRENFIQKLKSYKIAYFLLFAAVVSVIIIFPQIKSTLELIPFTERGQDLSSQFTGLGSLPLKGFLTFFYPYYMGNAGDATFELNDIYMFWEFFHYTGAIISLLAIFGAITMWKRTEYRSYIIPLVIIAVLGYVLATGENLQVYKIFTLFPFTKSFRFPVRWLVGTEISILILSGFGVISLVEFFTKKTKFDNKSVKKKLKSSDQQTKSESPVPFNTQFAAAIIISIAAMLEIYVVAGKQVTGADAGLYLNPPSYVNAIREENKNVPATRLFSLSRSNYMVGAYMKSRGWEEKLDLFSLGDKLVPENLGAYWGIPSINGYFLLVPSYIYEVWGDANHNGILTKTASLYEDRYFKTTDKFIKLSKLFGLKYVTSVWSLPQPYFKAFDSLGIREYILPDTFSKAWIVPKVDGFTSASNQVNANALINDDFDPWKSAYVDGAPPVLPAGSRTGSAEILEYSDHSLKIKANAPGFVVLNDTWYPRWKAYIDGQEVPVYKTNVMMRGVVAPREGTIIELEYDKENIFVFELISYVSILISLCFLYFEKKKNLNFALYKNKKDGQ